MKEHDFLVAGLNNPDTSIGDMRALGMNMTNTLLLSKDEYLKSDYIRQHDAFKDDEGLFSQTKFDRIYEEQLLNFLKFSEIEDGFLYDMYDFRRFDSPNSLVKNPNIAVYKVDNPFESTIGTGWINTEYESPLSISELAQKSKIYDHSTGTYLDYSPNDHALFSNPIAWFKDIFEEPLVLATYDEGETSVDKYTGELIVHKKGDKKVNEDGKFYYETLNGRSIYGKQVLSGWDTLTVDGSGFNSIDFMDSDDKDKSIGGTIVKTAAYIAPLFLSGPIGTLYTTTIIAKELMKTLPMLDGIFGAIDNSDTWFTPYANTLAAKGMAMSTGVSEYSQQNLISFENVANLLGDVALQWNQLLLIAKNILKLGQYNTITKSAKEAAHAQYLTAVDDYTRAANTQIQAFTQAGKLDKANKVRADLAKIVGDPSKWETSSLGSNYLANAMVGISPKLLELSKLGRSASLMYMALISNTDVYLSMLLHGATKREAITVALGSMLGMYAVDTSGLGEVFFNNLTSDATKSIRATLRNNADEWVTTLTKNIASPKTGNVNKLQTLFRQGQTLGKRLYSEFWEDIKTHSGGFFTKALGEGLEEAGEELAADASKQIYELMADILPVSDFFGGLTTNNVNAFSNVFENGEVGVKDLLTRYGMNFAGGFLGGGLFYGVERFKTNNWRRDTSQDKMIYLLRNNKKSSVLHVLEEYKKSGKLGSTTLSSQFELDSEGKPVFLSVNENNISQNDFIYNLIKMEIETLDKIISDNGLAMSDGLLLDRVTLGDVRFNDLREILKDAEYLTGYVLRYDKLILDYIRLEQEINAEKAKPIKDSDKESQEDREEQILKLTKLKEEKLKEIDDFKSGENALDYMGKLLFLMNLDVSKPFYTAVFDGWLIRNKNISIQKFDMLPPDELDKLREEYFQYKNSNQHIDSEEAWINFKYFQDKIKNNLNGIQDKVAIYEEYLEKLNELLDPKNNPFATRKIYEADLFSEDNEDVDLMLSYDEILYDESVDDYNNRNNLDDEKRAIRYRKLQELKAKEMNDDSMIKALELVKDIIINSGGILDPQSRRHLMLNIGVSRGDIVDEYKKFLQPGDNITNRIYNTILLELDQLHSIEEIQDQLRNIQQLSIDAFEEDVREMAEDRKDTINKVSSFLNSRGITDISIDPILDDINNLTLLFSTINSKYSQEEFINKSDNEKFRDLISLGLDGIQAKFIIDYYNTLNGSSANKTDLENAYISKKYNNNIVRIILDLKNNKVSNNQINKYLTEFNDIYESVTYTDDDGYEYSYIRVNPDKIKTSKYYLDNVSEILLDTIKLVDKLILDVRNDSVYSLLSTIEEATPIENPIVDIVKTLGLSLNRDVKDIELLLNTLELKLIKGSFSDFTLSPQQRNALAEAETLLELAGAYLAATYNSKDLANPYPHNLLINELILEHKLDKELLPVIDDSIAPLFSQQISNLRHEIGISDPEHGFTFGSWRYWDLKNALNKANQFLNSDIKLDEIKLNFFGKYRYLFKNIEINGTLYDLLEGYENILLNGSDHFKQLVGVENLFYENIRKIITTTGKSFYEILKNSKLQKLLTSNNDTLIEQSTAELNESITVDKLTPMDIGLYLTTLAGLSATEYYSSLSNNSIYENDKIAPLSVLLHVSRTAMSYINNSELYNLGLQWMYELTDYSQTPIGNTKPYLLNALFIPGNGGAGKTEVVFPTIVNFAKTLKKLKNDEIWVSAPTKRQYDKLVNLSGALGYDAKELCEKLIGSLMYADLLTEASNTGLSNYLTEVKTTTGKKIKVVNDSIQYTTTKIPKLIVIDEATHFSTLLLSIVSTFCKKHNIPLILLGDNFQQGHKILEGIEDNVNLEVVFTGKTSRLGITLRDSNYQKLTNVQQLVSFLDLLDRVPVGPSRQLLLLNLLDKFEKLSISYYNSTDINGDLLVEKIDESLINKCRTLIKNKQIVVGYLGNSADPEYTKLCTKFGQDNVILFTNEVELQGLEVDYMFIKTTWKSFDDSNLELKHLKLSDFLKRFYTLSTRGKVASVFVDDGNLKNLIKFEKQLHQNIQTNFDEKAIKKFKDYFNNKLSKLDLINVNESTESTTESTESATSSGSTTPGTGHASVYDNDDEEEGGSISVARPQSFDELELEIISESEKDGLLLIDDIINPDEALVYGEAHFLGVSKLKDGSWDFPTNSTVLRDIAIFLEEGTLISNGVDKNALVLKLLRLKSIILYESKIVDFNRNELLEDLKDIVDEKILKEIEFKLVVSKFDYSKHTFVGESKLTYDKIKIDSDNVFQLCAAFKNKKGKECLLTLGLLASPDTFKQNIDDNNLKNIIQQRINKIKESSNISQGNKDEIIERLENFSNLLSDIQESYKQNLQNYSRELKNSGKSELIFDIRKLTFNRSTVIRIIENSKKKDVEGKYILIPVPRMRLSNFDVSSNQIKEGDVIRLTNFHRHNPYAVVSPIYVYRLNAEATNKMNSIRGKAVIFVTRDLTLKGHPELLINRWIEEKKSNSPIHTVRMLRLDNAGVTLTDLCNSYYHDVFTTKATTGGEVDTLPFDNDIMGERMLIALHNFRANITRFNNYLESHPINNFKSEDIDRVLNEMYKYHLDNLNLTDTEILNNFTGKDLLIALQILNFNDQCDKQQLRLFRLGGNKANGNAWLIRKTFVTLGKDNKYYNNDDARLANRKLKGEEFENSVNAIYLTTAAAQKFQKVIEEVCDAILDPFEIEIFDNIKGRVVTEDEFVPITSKIYTALRSEVNGRIPYEIRYTENINRAVKYIPRSIIKLASRAIAYSKTEIDSNTGLRYLPAKDNLEQRDWSWDSADKLYYSITDLLDPDGPKIKKELSFRNLIENYGEDLVKILDLCFHGTSNTKGLVDAKLYGKQLKKGDQTYWSQVESLSTDALFKNGFYIDPMASVNGFDPGIRIEGYGLFSEVQTDPSLFTVLAAVDMPRFKIQFKLETTTSEQISTEEIKDDIALILNSNFWEQNQADIIHDLTSGSNTEIQEQIKGYFKSVGLSDNVNFSKIYSYNSYIVFTNDEDVLLFIDPTQPTAFKLNTVPLDDDSNIKIKFFKNWVETYKENNAGLFKVIHNHFLNPDNNYYIDIFEMETNPNNLVEFLETLSDTDSITTFVNLLPEIDKITDSYIILTLIDTINDEMCNV